MDQGGVVHQEAASPSATTEDKSQTRAKVPLPVQVLPGLQPSVTTKSSATLLVATSGQSSEMLLATLATATAARGARQVCGQKGKYFICWSIEKYCLSVNLNPCEGLSNKIMLNYLAY